MVYCPKIKKELINKLYLYKHSLKKKIPMTRLVNEAIEEYLMDRTENKIVTKIDDTEMETKNNTMDKIDSNRGTPRLRYVKFKYAVYDFGNGEKLIFEPIPYWDSNHYDGLIEMGIEKYIFKTVGNFSKNNIHKETLDNFDKFLSKYLNALRILS